MDSLLIPNGFPMDSLRIHNGEQRLANNVCLSHDCFCVRVHRNVHLATECCWESTALTTTDWLALSLIYISQFLANNLCRILEGLQQLWRKRVDHGTRNIHCCAASSLWSKRVEHGTRAQRNTRHSQLVRAEQSQSHSFPMDSPRIHNG